MPSSLSLLLSRNYHHHVTRSLIYKRQTRLPLQVLCNSKAIDYTKATCSSTNYYHYHARHSIYSFSYLKKDQTPKLQCFPWELLSPLRNSSVTRCFGSKAGKMGKHLQNLDEMAHEKYRKNKKNNKHQGSTTTNDIEESSPALEHVPEMTFHHQEDENETKFDHGGGTDESSPTLPTKQDVKERMMKVVHAMEDSFRSIRGAEASPELFDSVQVKAYGSMTPLNVLAQVVITSPTMATITCFDPDTTNAVRDAVRDMAGMNFNPRVEEGTIIVPIPRVSMETRKAIVKQIGKVAESTRQRVRRIRRAAQDVVKLGKDGKLGPGISEDDAFRAAKDIDAVTEECIKVLNDVVETKQESILTV